MSKQTAVITIRVDKDVKDRLDNFNKESLYKINLSEVVRKAIIDAIENGEKLGKK